MGDLPQPDNNVLSETLWNSDHNIGGSAIPAAAMIAGYSGVVPIGAARPLGTYITQLAVLYAYLCTCLS